MQIINKEPLPTGSRFYEIENEDLKEHLKMVLSLKYFKTIREFVKASEEKRTAGVIRDLALPSSMHSYVRSILSDEDSEYPSFTISSADECFILKETEIDFKFKKSYFNSVRRLVGSGLELPLDENQNITLQWCNDRGGLIVHNHPYEGPLQNAGSMKVAAQLTEVLNDQIKVVEMSNIIGLDVKPRDYSHYAGADAKAVATHELFPQLALGNIEPEDAVTLLLYLGYMQRGYDYNAGKVVFRPTPEKYRKLKIPSAVRTKLVYMYGGFKLPDNHMEWFDN